MTAMSPGERRPPPAIHCWRYALRPLGPLNARSGAAPREGALIRLDDGFGCLHPWPELGDPALEELLASLASSLASSVASPTASAPAKPPHPLVASALECAQLDGAARRAGRPLFDGRAPESHWLALDGDEPEEAAAAGFSTVKIKAGPDLDRVIRQIDRWGAAGLRLRLDFNESLPCGAFLDCWRSLGAARHDRIELVEDPEAWSEAGWAALRRAGVPVAVDRDHRDRLRHGDVLVHKPALDGFDCGHDGRFYFTSYMDHALGQVWAGAAAAAAAQGRGKALLPCGLLTQRCYEPDPFFEHLRCDGPRLLHPGGTGLGFDDLLERLPWKRLA